MKKYVFIFLYLSGLSLSAQNSIETTPTILDKTEFKIGYMGNLIWKYGLNFGAEYLWKEKVKKKEKKRKEKVITQQLLLNGNLAFTNNFAANTDAAIFTNYGLIWRRTNIKGKQISIEFNPLGYYRSLLPETYEVSGDDVKKVFLPGRSYYAPSLSIGIGKLRKGKKLTGRYINLNIMWRAPYNGGIIDTISLQYGFRFGLKKNK